LDSFFEEQPVPWYLAHFLNTLRTIDSPDRYSDYSIIVKACRDHNFYVLEAFDRLEKKLKLLNPPFFESAPPPTDPEKEVEKIRGLADTILFLAPDLLARPNEHMVGELIRWYQIKLEFTNLPSPESDLLALGISPKVEYGKFISLPPDSQKVLMSSYNVREAVANLSETWKNPAARSVLIAAWTGSGKDVLVNLLIDAMRISKEDRIDVSASALSGFNALKTIVATKFTGHRTALFLDEIHHPSARDIRAGLLRLMESGNLESNRGKALDCKAMMYIFAASLPVEKLRTLYPPDLWNRIQYTITLHHPLLIQDDLERQEIVKDYFSLFWEREADEWKTTGERLTGIHFVLSDTPLLSQFRDMFAEDLGSPLVPLISLRTLRTIVQRLFSRTADFIRLHPEIEDEARLGIRIQREFKKWIVEIYHELVPEIDTKGVF
jgi:hypothetical protein